MKSIHIVAVVAFLLGIAVALPSSETYKLSRSENASSWQQYVRAPSSNIIPPAKVVSYTGNITNPNALLASGGAVTTLSRPTATDESPMIVIDFGQNTVGYLSIDFAGASNNTPGIRLAFSETLEYLTNLSDFSRSYNGDTITPGSDQIAVLPNPYTWTDSYGCENITQICSDGLHGFRYLKIYLDALPSDAPITAAYGDVLIDYLNLNFSGYLGTPDTFNGWFESSDANLTQWWYNGVYTNDMCTDNFGINNTDPRGAASPTLLGKLVIFDGAKRDRDPYSGDLTVSAKTAYLSHNVSIAARNVLADLAEHQRADGWIPPASINNYTLALLDYPLYWVTNSYDLFVYTGDTDYITQYYQVLVNVLDDFYPSITSSTNGLLTKGLGVSGSYGDYAFLPRTGQVTYYNALYVLALQNAASIATFVGNNSDAARWTARAANVSVAINEYRFDDSVGAFFDGDCDSAPCPTHAQDGNSISIISGVTNTSRSQSVLSYLAANTAHAYGNSFYDNDYYSTGFSERVYAFISYFELAARFETNLANSALEEIRRLYGWMASNDPTVTFWEGIGGDGAPYEGDYTSMAHGWSTGIVPLLTNYVLGIIPTGPGFMTWSVKPYPGDLGWAKGEVHTPRGPIIVSWIAQSGTFSFQLTISAPAGTSGTVSVPANSSSVVTVDKADIENAAPAIGIYQDGYISVNVTGGVQYVITVD